MRFSQTDTQRNGVYPNQIMSIQSLLSSSQSLLSYVPGATQLALQPTNAPGTNYTNPNSMVLIGGLRAITMPVHEQINDTHIGRKFDLDGQTHNVTAGYYYAHFTQDFDRYSSSVLLGAQSNAPLLDLVGTNAAGTVLGSVTDHGIYNYGYEWAHAGGTSTTNALYLSDEWQVNNKLRIDAGVRDEQVETAGWTELSQTVNLGTFATSKILTGTGQLATYDHTFRKTGWTLGANYQLDRDAGVFGRWTNAFRLPNLSSYITSPTATPITQTMGLGEIGYKYKSPLVEFYPTMFYTTYDNVSYTNQVFSLNNATVVPVIGYASTKTYGLELEGKVNAAPWADFGFDATLQQPKYKDLIYNDQVNGQPVLRNYDGNQLIRVPKVSYRLVPGLNLMNDRLRLQFSYEYEGKRFVDAANTVVLPSYQTVNFSSRYALSKATSIYFYIDNLNNSQGLTEGNPRAGEIVSADAGANAFIARPLLGRSVRLAMMYQF
jgi:outer membrane receptor protein involved in Fe transport